MMKLYSILIIVVSYLLTPLFVPWTLFAWCFCRINGIPVDKDRFGKIFNFFVFPMTLISVLTVIYLWRSRGLRV